MPTQQFNTVIFIIPTPGADPVIPLPELASPYTMSWEEPLEPGDTFQITGDGGQTIPGVTYTYNGVSANGEPSLTAATPLGLTSNFFLTDLDYDIGDPAPPFDDIPFCFLVGTLIATPTGDVAVEDLSIGDLVLTPDGRAVRVKWLGRQTIYAGFGLTARRHPVQIASGALGDNLPNRDLRLTSDHALLIDGVLVHAGAMVNGTTIRRIPLKELGERFVVYHIETENHEVVLAEGAPAETFIDNVSRTHFDNYAEYLELFGREMASMRELDQPRAMSHRQVPPTIRKRIAAAAAKIASEDQRAA